MKIKTNKYRGLTFLAKQVQTVSVLQAHIHCQLLNLDVQNQNMCTEMENKKLG